MTDSEYGHCPVCDSDQKPHNGTCRECGFSGRCHECGEETFADWGDPNFCSAGCRQLARMAQKADEYL